MKFICFRFFSKEKFKEIALENECVTEAIALSMRDSLLDILLEGAPWKKRKTVYVDYHYQIKGKHYFKEMKYIFEKGDEGKFIAKYPYQMKVYYYPDNPKVMYWEKDETFCDVLKEV